MKLTQSIQQAYRMRFPANSLRKRFAEGMTWVIAGTSVRQAANFLAGIIVARLLGVADFGKLAVVQSTVLMLANFGQAGIGLASTQHVASLRTLEPERTGRIIGFSLAFTYVFALLMGMLLSLFSSWIAQRILPGSRIRMEIMIAGGWIVFEIISMLQLRILTGLEAFRSSAMINLCQGVLLLPIMYYGASYGGVLGSVLALTGVSVVGSIIGHFILRAKCGFLSIDINYRDSWQERTILRMSLKVWCSDMAMNTANWLAGILLARQPLGLREFGLFNAAGRLQSVLLFLPSRIFQVTVPVLANLQAEGNRRGFIKALAGVATLTVLVTGFFAGIFLLFPDQLMSLFGREFAKGSGVLRIIAVVCVASSAWTVATAGLWAARKANQMLILDGTRGLLLVGICLSGFVVNARSLAFAFLASYLVGLVLLSGVLFRFVRQPWPSEKLAYQNNSRGV